MSSAEFVKLRRSFSDTLVEGKTGIVRKPTHVVWRRW